MAVVYCFYSDKNTMFMNNIFQPKNYFKGWYFKCSSQNQTVAFIPAFHRNNGRESASLQIITDEAAFHIPFHSLIYREKPLSAKLGDSVFSNKGIRLHIQTDKLSAEGVLRFGKLSPIRYDIMGRSVLFPLCNAVTASTV